MALQENFDIPRLRRMKGISRVWKPNPISELILGIDFENFPGIWHEFLESCSSQTEMGEWIEHKWVLRGIKDQDKPGWIGELIENLGKLLSRLSLNSTWEREVEWWGLSEIEPDDPSHYYFLISIISNGIDYNPEEKDRSKEKES